MKHYLLPILVVAATQGMQAQIANGNFDEWTAIDLFEHPAMNVQSSSSNYELFLEEGLLNVTAVESPNGQAMRIENISAGDNVFPGYFVTGETPRDAGDGLIFGGGIALTDGNVNGVSLNLRYNISSESPGFVIVQFKKNGVPVGSGNMGVGTMMVPLEGEQDWHVMNVTFDEAFAETPDACVVGVASANLLGDDQPFPAGSFVEVDEVSFLNSNQTFPGGNFDNWTDVAPIWTPDGILVDIDVNESLYEQSMDAHSGSFALALRSVAYEDGWNVGRAIFASGTMENPVPNIQLNPDNATISFMYKYMAEDDLAQVNFTFYNEDAPGEFSHVYQREMELEPTNDYSAVVFNFAEELELLNISASHVSITFQSSSMMNNNVPKDGSMLLIDDVTMSQPLSVFGIKTMAPQVTASPNPTKYRVTFTFSDQRTGLFRVLNRAGVQLDVRQFQNQKEVVYDLSSFRAGVYLFRFQHDQGTNVVRVVKL